MSWLGIDTSNYTTSVALYDGSSGRNCSRLLDVAEGQLGLRQSEALFSHVKRLPELMEQLCGERLPVLSAIAASTRPRPVEGSYMPCFLAGESLGRSLASAFGVPFYAFSHQEGHFAAAAWSAGRLELLDAPFLAWHLSGGTTELLYVEPLCAGFCVKRIGGTTDLSAGQLIDRTGKLLGLPFPSGKHLDALSQSAGAVTPFHIKCNDLSFSLSGAENQTRAFFERGADAAQTAAFAIGTLCGAVVRTTEDARKRYPGLPILFSGGVSSNSALRRACAEFTPIFAEPQFSTDNAMGAAVLAARQEVLNGSSDT